VQSNKKFRIDPHTRKFVRVRSPTVVVGAVGVGGKKGDGDEEGDSVDKEKQLRELALTLKVSVYICSVLCCCQCFVLLSMICVVINDLCCFQ